MNAITQMQSSPPDQSNGSFLIGILLYVPVLLLLLLGLLCWLACDIALLVRVWLGRSGVMKPYAGFYRPFGKLLENPKEQAS